MWAVVDWQPIVDAIAQFLVPAIAAFLSGLAWRNARAANKAVNNVPKGAPTILDRVDDIHQAVVEKFNGSGDSK